MRKLVRSWVVAFILFLGIAGGGIYSHEKHGFVGEDIVLEIQQSLPHPVKEVIWKIGNGGQTFKTFKIAEYKEKKLKIHYPQFQNRLKTSNGGKQLKITNGTIKDSGNYLAKITLENNEVLDESIRVTVFKKEDMEKDFTGSNVTHPGDAGRLNSKTGPYRNRWLIVISLVLVVSLAFGIIICYKKEELKQSIPETIPLSYPTEEELFYVSEKAIKYPEFISIH
ncbi:uncharacterized protein [Pyxicephalus adspersus]|uniref:uncharacterized protein n=1 Tax=Pyxicephalus adspersus TaxID=30357 RepID=UPI003B5B43B0